MRKKICFNVTVLSLALLLLLPIIHPTTSTLDVSPAQPQEEYPIQPLDDGPPKNSPI